MTEIKEMHEKCLQILLTEFPNVSAGLRQTNRYDRLTKGYWFRGSDTYISISFWDAHDWRNKTANIYLQFGSDGKALLLLIDNDNSEKEAFFAKIAPALSLTKTTRRTFGNYWFKEYPQKDFGDILRDFIRTEKPIIDFLIKENKLEKVLPQVSMQDYQKNLKRIADYRGKNTLHTAAPKFYKKLVEREIRLQQLELQNIGHYDKLTLDLNHQITCLIGKNGSGKTTLLRGVALGLTGITPFIEDAKKPSIQCLLKLKSAEKEKMQFQNAGFIRLTYKIDGQDGVNAIQFKPAPYLNYHFIEDIETDGNSFIISGDDDNLLRYPIIGFSQQMHVDFEDNKLGDVSINQPNTNDLRVLILNEPDNRFDDIARWFKRAVDVDTPIEERKKLKIVIEKLLAVLNQLTKNDLKLLAIDDGKEARLSSTDFPKGLPLSMLSQGYFNVIGWVGFFMKRLWESTPDDQKDQFSNTSAVCLIDEIDTYLHPEWQAGLLGILAKSFPKTQFIVTTHSPYIITHLENKNDSVQTFLVTNESVTPIQTSGRDLTTTSTEFFGVERRPMFYQNLINAVFADFDKYENGTLANGSIDKLKTKIEQIEKLLGKNDPDVKTAKDLLDTLIILEA